MTEKVFNELIRKGKKANDRLNYLQCFFAIGLGTYFLYQGISGYDSSGDQFYFILSLPAFLLGLGFYGIWRIPQDYRILVVDSKKSLDEKKKVIKEYLSFREVISLYEEPNYIKCRYRNRFWNKVDLFLLLNNERVLVNAQGVDWSVSKGIIDFGLTNRAQKSAKKFLEKRLPD